MSGEYLYFEQHNATAGLRLRVKRHLAHKRSKFQIIDLFETEEFGVVMTLDGLVMLTERDECAYHEMLVHVPMLTHPDPRRVLVVGGGDGGTLRELLRHPTLEQVVQVEIDGDVVSLSKKFFPWADAVYRHRKVKLVVDDALKYIAQTKRKFDVILVDSTDPIGPAVGLFDEPFYRKVHRALNPDGILCSQVGSPFYNSSEISQILARLRKLFVQAELYTTHIPTYPSGLWGMAIASKNPKKNIRSSLDKVRYNTFKDELKYYNTAIHAGAYMLPEYLKRALYQTG